MLCRKASELENELRSIGINLKTLEVNEERSIHRENSYSELVKSLQNRVKEVTERSNRMSAVSVCTLWFVRALFRRRPASFLVSLLRFRSDR